MTFVSRLNRRLRNFKLRRAEKNMGSIGRVRLGLLNFHSNLSAEEYVEDATLKRSVIPKKLRIRGADGNIGLRTFK